MATSSLLVFFVLFISVTSTWAMQSFYPCPGNKAQFGNGVNCKVVKLPPGMCQSCPLKAPAANGQFKQCNNIYETSTATCKAAMNQYVKANPCDTVRKKAMDGINSGNPSFNNLVTMDYFMYSVCEQCCDCIPIGASKTANSGQWVTDRGNCPAHAWYDICAVLPKVTWFVKIGESTAGHANKPAMCSELKGWFNSPQSKNWQKNPKTQLTNTLDASLASVLDATSCSASSIWNKCFDLEKKQGNLGKEGDFTGSGSTGSTNTNSGGNTNTNNGGSNTNTGNTNTGNTNTGSTNTNSGSGNTGCTGAVKWGCIGWSNASKKCEGGHKCKCFPDQPKSSSQGSCAGKIPVGANTGGSTSTNTGSNNNSGSGSNTSSGGSNPGGATVSCNGAFKWGCTNWSTAQGKCVKHGCKCFPGAFQPTPASCFTSGGLVKQNAQKSKSSPTCFPGDATVVLGDGSATEMANLNIGDVVMSAPGKYSQVYLFSHRHSDISTEHVEVSLGDYQDRVLTLTGGHHLRVNGVLKAASKIRIGDALETVDGVKRVEKLRIVEKKGLYNPHTLDGTIVVNGVICSTFTEEIDASAANALLAPMRTLYRTGSISEYTAGSFMQHGATTVQ